MKNDPMLPESDGLGMCLREKYAWICLVTTAAVYVPYFVYVIHLVHGEHPHLGHLFAAWIYAVVLQTLLSIAATLVFAVQQRKEPKDERDAAIEARSFRYAYGFLAVCCFLLVVIIPHFGLGLPGGHAGFGTMLLLLAAQSVLLIFVSAEIVKYLTLAIGYRRAI